MEMLTLEDGEPAAALRAQQTAASARPARVAAGPVALMAYALVAYALFTASLLWSVGFLADAFTGKTVDSGAAPSWPVALIIDSSLLLLFALQHSVMARPAFKRAWLRIVPEPAERSTYVLLASAVLLLVLWQWKPLTANLWNVGAALPSALIWAVFALGWLVAVSSTYMIDHMDLFGLRQAYLHLRDRDCRPVEFRERWLYALVRHPLMLGLLIAFWATPHMTAGHLLFAGLATGYILVGTRFEEHDLRESLGEVYGRYAARVPALIPMPWRRRDGRDGPR